MKIVRPQVRLAVAAEAVTGERPFWSARRGRLLWIDDAEGGPPGPRRA